MLRALAVSSLLLLLLPACRKEVHGSADAGSRSADAPAKSSAPACLPHAIAWGAAEVMPARNYHHRLEPCRKYTLTASDMMGPSSSCSVELSSLNPRLAAVLADPDVVSGLAANQKFGKDNRAIDIPPTKVSVGSGQLLIGQCSATCPRAVVELQELLMAFEREHVCDPP